MTFGFRVYTFQTFKRKGRTPEDLSAIAADHASTVAALLDAYRGEVLSGRPDYQDLRGEVPEASPGDYEIKIQSVDQVGLTVRCEVSFGKIGGHDDLLRRDGRSTSIVGDSATRRFRVDLYYPRSGDEGILVTEVRSRSAPVSDLLAWLRRFEALHFADDSSNVEYWRSIRIQTIADVDHLLALIKNARRTTVQFRSMGPPTARGRRPVKKGELEVTDVTSAQAAELVKEVVGWVEGNKKGAVARTASRVNLDLGKIRDGGMDVNRTTIRLEGDQPLSVSPDNVDDVFTYPLSKNLRLDGGSWRYRTVEKARDLAKQEALDLEFE
ncbi:hypothetical protein [Janibacter sp. GS2]|uniref:hypothetical protein n=1 Tax=Janibacter sp. GS2 TaxID=3442646 RepID=UPI003EB75F2A